MCTSPLPARRHPSGHIEFLGRSSMGRAPFVFSKSGAPRSDLLQIPCGQCTECRLKRSREWAIRCMHEASLHRDNCFLTLTISEPDKALSLNYDYFQAFMKRLRARFPRERIGFFCCGEYGETNPSTGIKDGGKYRAHFHAILFNFNFPDRVPCRLLDQSELFKSALCDELWRFGACRIGEVTFESAAYVARYAMKKVTGDLAEAAYTLVLPDGEIISRTPEMLVMSKRPAIGRRWFEKFGKTAVYRDSVIARGVETAMPRYYDKLLPRVVLSMLQRERSAEGGKRGLDHTDARDAVRDVVVKAKMGQFTRE